MTAVSARSRTRTTDDALTDGRQVAPTELSTRRIWLGFGALMLGLFTIISASTSVTTAIPQIQRELHASLSQVEWLLDSYLITIVVFLTSFGRLGDIFGRKRMFIAGGVLFSLGSIASALATDIQVLIVCRALTALGPAMMLPATLSLITDLFPPDKRGMPLGLWGSMAGVAVGVGPIMGGLLVSDAGWHWVFWSAAALAGVAVAMAARLLPPSRRGVRSGFDVPGILLNGGFILTLSYALVEGSNDGWRSPLIVSLFVSSAVLLVLFIWREFTAGEPMLDLSLFKRAAFSAGILVTAFISFSMFGIFVYVPLFLQGPKGDSAIESGLTILPLAVAMAIAGPIGGWLAGRVRPNRPIFVALLLFAGGMFWLAHLTVSTSWQWLIGPFILLGLGLGISSANINTAVMRAVPSSVAGAASGVVATVRQMGAVLGVAILGAVLQSRLDFHTSQTLRGGTHRGAQLSALVFTNALNDTLVVGAGVLLIGALAALLVRHRPEDEPVEQVESPASHGAHAGHAAVAE